MKGELLVLNNELSFFFKRVDIASTADKEAIKLMIHQMYHMHSKWTNHDIEHVDEIINQSKSAYIGLTMENSNPSEYDFTLKVLNYSNQEFNQIKMAQN